MVENQNIHGHHGYVSIRGERWPMPAKMICPVVLAGMEKANNFVGIGNPAGDIWTLKRIAVQATPGQVIFCSRPAMFLGNNVVDLKRIEGMAFWEVAIFATPDSPVGH